MLRSFFFSPTFMAINLFFIISIEATTRRMEGVIERERTSISVSQVIIARVPVGITFLPTFPIIDKGCQISTNSWNSIF